MTKRLSNIKAIGIGLTVLYAVSFSVYMYYYQIQSLKEQSVILLVLFGLLFFSSIAVIFIQEWGRILLVALNIILGLYLIRPYLTMDDFAPITYILMSVIIFLFFSQEKIRVFFGATKVEDGKWRSILVIDDDETLIKTVRPLLISNGFSVLTALTGEDGIQIAKSQKPDLILLDVILPGIKGREVCRTLKENNQTKHIPVVFFTAKDSADDIQAEMQAGAEDHLTKPLDPKILISTIKGILHS